MEKNKDILFQISTMSQEFVEKHGLDKSESTRLYLIGDMLLLIGEQMKCLALSICGKSF